jgi:hypothetical protein
MKARFVPAVAAVLVFAALAAGGSSAGGGGTPTHLVVMDATTVAGKGASLKVYEADGSNVLVKKVKATLQMTPDGSCAGPKCTATVAGPHSVTASYTDPVAGGLTTNSPGTLTVNPGKKTVGLLVTPGFTVEAVLPSNPPNMEVSDTSPNPATTAITVHGADAYGNDTGVDLTSQATFTPGAGATCVGSVCGNFTVFGQLADSIDVSVGKKLQGEGQLNAGTGTLSYTCKGEHYDVDGNHSNGCEQLQTNTSHAEDATATDLGSASCSDAASQQTVSSQNLYSDSRTHQNPTVAGFDTQVGSAPEWFKISATGGLCTDDYSLTFSTTGGASVAQCYKLTIVTDKITASTVPIGGSATAPTISGGASSYSDGTTIYFEVQKVCNLPIQEAVGYSFSFHL